MKNGVPQNVSLFDDEASDDDMSIDKHDTPSEFLNATESAGYARSSSLSSGTVAAAPSSGAGARPQRTRQRRYVRRRDDEEQVMHDTPERRKRQQVNTRRKIEASRKRARLRAKTPGSFGSARSRPSSRRAGSRSESSTTSPWPWSNPSTSARCCGRTTFRTGSSCTLTWTYGRGARLL